jgi:hypothetical protein
MKVQSRVDATINQVELVYMKHIKNIEQFIYKMFLKFSSIIENPKH